MLCGNMSFIILLQGVEFTSDWLCLFLTGPSSVAAGTLQGYHVDKQSLSVTQLWTSVYSAGGVGILEVAARNPAEHVYSPAKVRRNSKDSSSLMCVID